MPYAKMRFKNHIEAESTIPNVNQSDHRGLLNPLS
jgi:hypothetical protein